MRDPATVQFPKTIRLKDGNEVLLRFLEAGDRDRLLEFFKGIPEEERVFLRDDFTRPEAVEARFRAIGRGRLVALVAETEGRIVGDATLDRRPTHWLHHVAEVHVVVDRTYRRLGLAYRLLYELFDLARERGVETLLAEMMSEQLAAINLFERLGFRREATFVELVRDLRGHKHDLVIMTRDLAERGRRKFSWFW
jgi:L-amino acid N-acyltransferase YncA